MTSTPINGMADFSNFMKNPNAAQNKSDMPIETNFAKTMSKVSDDLVAGKGSKTSEFTKSNAAKDDMKSQSKDKSNQPVENRKTDQTTNDKYEKTEKLEENTSVNQTEDNVDSSSDSQQASQIQEKAEKVLEQVAEELDVSVEEIEKVMEELGITLIGLLDTNQLSNVVVEVSGAEDMMALVTDESLYQSMTKLTEVAQSATGELQEELQLSGDELQVLLTQIEEQIANDSEENMASVPETDIESLNTESVNQNAQTFLAQENDLPKNEIKSDVKEAKDDEIKTEFVENASEDAEKTVTVEQTNGQKLNQNHSKNEGNEGNEGNFSNLMNQQIAQDSVSTEVVDGNATVAEYTPEPQEIANQIMDYMKTQMRAEITELEIQLHPASLGTININLQTREGNLTAQFTAQNELVRSVIESQIAQLQSQLEDQGIKVDAVEVTVASHQFERNFNQEQGQSSGEQPKKRGARRIDLNALSDISDEELAEEDQITADMMARNGNSVDYTV